MEFLVLLILFVLILGAVVIVKMLTDIIEILARLTIEVLRKDYPEVDDMANKFFAKEYKEKQELENE